MVSRPSPHESDPLVFLFHIFHPSVALTSADTTVPPSLSLDASNKIIMKTNLLSNVEKDRGDDGATTTTTTKEGTTEDVLAVPKVWTKRAYQFCLEDQVVARTWHLEGRWGSRTHVIDEERMGFPILSSLVPSNVQTEDPSSPPPPTTPTPDFESIQNLQDLFKYVPGVEILKERPFVPSKRARECPMLDATIHPERQRRHERRKEQPQETPPLPPPQQQPQSERNDDNVDNDDDDPRPMKRSRNQNNNNNNNDDHDNGDDDQTKKKKIDQGSSDQQQEQRHEEEDSQQEAVVGLGNSSSSSPLDTLLSPTKEEQPLSPPSLSETQRNLEGIDDSGETTTTTTTNHSFTYAELFCGIGGFGIALEALGGQCLFVSEMDELCREVYIQNFPNTPTHRIYGDIYQIPSSDFPQPGTLDLLVGGFPCQPFSNLSNQPGFHCEKGRGMLFQEIVRVLQYSQPKAFLLENVPGLKDMKEAYNHIVSSFESAGYTVVTEVCNAKAVTATTRKRLFFVGLRKNLRPIQHDHGSNTTNATTTTPPDETTTTNSTDVTKTPPTTDVEPQFAFPYIPDLQLRAEHVIDYDELPKEELDILRLSKDSFDQLLAGKRWRPHSLAWPNRPLDTMTSHYGNAVGRGESQLVPCHAPYNPRRFSPRECARLMGFPNTFQFIPPKAQQGDMAYRKQFYRMFGNAVCPPIIAALAGAVLDRCHLLPPPDNKNNKNYGGDRDEIDSWTAKGLTIAIDLAKAALRPTEPVVQPMGCLVWNDDDVDHHHHKSQQEGKKKPPKQSSS